MTDNTPKWQAPEALQTIQRFEVVDCIDSKHVPAVIPNAYGPWVRYEDHAAQVAALTAAPATFQRALDIRAAQGWKLGGDKVPVLYTDSINGEQVSRDDLWLCTTAALAAEAPAAGAVAGPSESDREELEAVIACLGDDAATLRDQNPECEMAANMDRAAEMLAATPTPAAQGDALDAAFEAVRKRLCGMQRYSFVLDDDGVVRRVQDRTGNWIEFDEAHALLDPVAVDAAIDAERAALAQTGENP